MADAMLLSSSRVDAAILVGFLRLVCQALLGTDGAVLIDIGRIVGSCRRRRGRIGTCRRGGSGFLAAISRRRATVATMRRWWTIGMAGARCIELCVELIRQFLQ